MALTLVAAGVPIVPCLAEAGFSASGWLGILTAGLLWTKMYDASTLAKDVDSLIAQIADAMNPESRDEASLAEAVSTADVKNELLRLQQDSRLASGSASGNQSSGKALVPALVPTLPTGVLVTPAMKDLLSKVSDMSLPRVGFVGMVSSKGSLSCPP